MTPVPRPCHLRGVPNLARRVAAKLAAVTLAILAIAMTGCDSRPAAGEARVIAVIGRGGRGPGEFLYPRGVDVGPDGSFWVVDRTGRIQRLSPAGQALATVTVPETTNGYPIGLGLGPDGRLYVADTHYNRVLIYKDMVLAGSFGDFGTSPGEFIYPTDVAFAGNHIYVSEYGGNDRVSMFTADGKFVRSFGRPGSGDGEFSRPAAMAIDEARGTLYVADSCNHRIVRLSLDGAWMGSFGSEGSGPGNLRYPYGLALRPDGTLAVSEYGNNRVQVFDAEGRSLSVMGGAGREPGRLAYPWGIAAAGDTLVIVDAGNNRLQVWQP